MIRSGLVTVLLIAPLAGTAFAAERLTIGSPAPPLELGTFVKGEPVKGLERGVVYVVEFSGTDCAPCHRAIPILTELQKKHPRVVFVSVYDEREAGVRAYVANQGERMGFRVALDPEGAMDKAWMQAAGLRGIPTVFVVGTDGKIAWIGHPFVLADPLQKLLEGKLDARPARVWLRFEQADLKALSDLERRREEAEALESRIGELLTQQKWPEALAAAEQAIRDYPEKLTDCSAM